MWNNLVDKVLWMSRKTFVWWRKSPSWLLRKWRTLQDRSRYVSLSTIKRRPDEQNLRGFSRSGGACGTKLYGLLELKSISIKMMERGKCRETWCFCDRLSTLMTSFCVLTFRQTHQNSMEHFSSFSRTTNLATQTKELFRMKRWNMLNWLNIWPDVLAVLVYICVPLLWPEAVR